MWLFGDDCRHMNATCHGTFVVAHCISCALFILCRNAIFTFVQISHDIFLYRDRIWLNGVDICGFHRFGRHFQTRKHELMYHSRFTHLRANTTIFHLKGADSSQSIKTQSHEAIVFIPVYRHSSSPLAYEWYICEWRSRWVSLVYLKSTSGALSVWWTP